MEELSEYEKARGEAQSLYANTKPIYSPALNQDVHFTAEGFNHLLFKGSRLDRDRESQMLRFRFLPLAIKLIGISTTYQEFEETMREFEIKKNKRRIQKNKLVRYWGIIAIIQGRKIRVVLRKIADGALHFWSIIPNWSTSTYRDIKFFNTMGGNPEQD